MTPAIILLGHGSRDPAWSRPMQAVADRLTRQAPAMRVRCAYLELQTPTLPEAVDALAAEGVRSVRILPLFLGVGRHAREDLPRLLREAAARHPSIALELRPAVGEEPRLLDLLATLALEPDPSDTEA